LKKRASMGMPSFMQTNTEPMDTSNVFCPNLACSARGKTGIKQGQAYGWDYSGVWPG